MTKNHTFLLSALAALCAALASSAVLAQSAPAATLNAPAQRITDAAISADQQAYETLQARLKALSDAGRPLRDYHLAKAQCWLDVSFHEYSRNDRSAFPQDALGQAHQLALGMERGQPPLTMDTPLVAGTQRLRPDLWDHAAALKGQRGWRCAQQKTACAEVELVHAGNEQAQQGWRHAKPYVQIAEDLIAEAQLLAERCDPPPAPAAVAAAAVVAAPMAAASPVVAVPVPVVAPAPPASPKRVELSAVVVFEFGKSDETGLRPESRRELEALATRFKAEQLSLRHLQLIGHADRLNSTGVSAYNQRLSERRAATVQALLARLGVPATGATLQAVGNGQQVQACGQQFATQALLQACLLPNRRVEVRLSAEAPAAR